MILISPMIPKTLMMEHAMRSPPLLYMHYKYVLWGLIAGPCVDMRPNWVVWPVLGLLLRYLDTIYTRDPCTWSGTRHLLQDINGRAPAKRGPNLIFPTVRSPMFLTLFTYVSNLVAF